MIHCQTAELYASVQENTAKSADEALFGEHKKHIDIRCPGLLFDGKAPDVKKIMVKVKI